MYDLVIKGGFVIDPSQSLSGPMDIAISAGQIAGIGASISEADSEAILNASECLVTPGLIDLHTHVWSGVAHLGIEGDPSCIAKGVTTAVDAGSAGSNTLAGLCRYVIDNSATRVLAFVNISGMGQLDLEIGELSDLRWARVDRAVEAARTHQNHVVGIKARLSKAICGPNDKAALGLAVEAGSELGLPVMIHIGDTAHELDVLLDFLRPGDIVTHAFTGWSPGILSSTQRVLPAVLEAHDRGVLFDVGHGAGSFTFSVAERALEQGFFPDTISSDVHHYNVNGPVYDLVTTMSKFLALGLSLEDVVGRATAKPAEAIGRSDTLGSIRIGSEADISVLKIEDGEFALTDAEGETRRSTQIIKAIASIRRGEIYETERSRQLLTQASQVSQ